MFDDIQAIKRASRLAGSHFFCPETMRFFGSRISSKVIGGRYFVTCEDDFSKSRRLYTVRKATWGRIETVGEFQQFPTLKTAKAFARKQPED
jgi:hypothetical protein